MSTIERLLAPTPKYFKGLRNIGLLIGAIGGAILTAPLSLPAWLLLAAKVMTIAGTVAAGVSQTAVKGDE
jgi:hypothetical protein